MSIAQATLDSGLWTRGFEEEVEGYLLQFLENKQCSYQEILEHGQNCDPVVLQNALEALLRTGTLTTHKCPKHGMEYLLAGRKPTDHSLEIPRESQKSARSNPFFTQECEETVDEILNALPEPSIVYSQWWYSRESYARLFPLLGQQRWRNGVFLGACSLGALVSRILSQPVTLIDIDASLLAAMKSHSGPNTTFVNADVNRLLASYDNAFDLAIADPPWGSNTLRQFLKCASRLLVNQGVLIISFPQALTRPGAGQEKGDFVSLAQKLGLDFFQQHTGLSSYSVPPFEKVAFEASGIPMPRPWRKGDILMFRKQQAVSDLNVDLRADAADVSWEQFNFRSQRLFVKRDGEAEMGLPMIMPIPGAEDFVCRSISSRNPIVQHASVVTTRNRVGSAQGRKQLCQVLPEVLQAIDANKQPCNAVVREAARDWTEDLRAMLLLSVSNGSFGVGDNMVKQ